jgi:hypothetical protein
MSLAGSVAYFTNKDPSLKIENVLDDVGQLVSIP